MSLKLKSFADLVSEQAAVMQGRANRLLDFTVGSVVRSIVEANAGIGLWLQSMALQVLAATRAATSTGADLDSFVGDFGVTRLGAAYSAGQVTFSRFTASVQAIIPIGATVQTADGTQSFVVVADTSNSSFSTLLGGYVMGADIFDLSVPVAAAASGGGGNVDAGTVTVITSQITYVDTVTNGAPMTGGAAEETDVDLRGRFARFINSLSRGTPSAIIYAISSLKSGARATIIEGEDPEGVATPGMLTITVDDGTGYPSADFVLRALAQANAYRAGGIRVGVFPAQVVEVDVSITISVSEGFDYQTIVGLVADTVESYIATLSLGQSLQINRLSQVAFNTSNGVANVTSLMVNYDQKDIIATPRQVIKPRLVMVS